MSIVRNYSRYKAETLLHASLDSFLVDDFKEGIQVIPFGESVLEIFVQDRGSATTLVLFHAAVDPAKTSLPVFIGHQLTAELEANLIFVSEPALDLGSPIGWFTGSPAGNLQQDLVRIIEYVQGSLESARHLMFYGSSAGGFASLYYSHQFENSLAIVANPQTDISKFYPEHVDKFINRVWDVTQIDEVTAQTEVCSLYQTKFPNFVGYLQNSNDELHIKEHCLPWASATTSSAQRRRFLIDNWGEGHAPPNFFVLQGILQYAASLDGDWEEFLQDDSFTPEPTFEN